MKEAVTRKDKETVERMYLDLMSWIHSLPDPGVAQNLKNDCQKLLESL